MQVCEPTPFANRLPRRLARTVLAIACAFLAASCDDSDADMNSEFEILVHPGATDVVRSRSRVFNPSWELDYRVNMTYPEMAIDGGRRKALIDLRWRECRNWSDSWEVFIDARQADRPLCRYEDLAYMIRDDSLMLITLGYTDKLVGDNSCAKTPSNRLQTVSVWVLTGDDVGRHIERLGLTCDP